MEPNLFKNCVELNKIKFPDLKFYATTYTTHQNVDMIEHLYSKIFFELSEKANNDERDNYNTLLKMYDYNYRQTVLAIEFNNSK